MDYATYKEKISSPTQRFQDTKNTLAITLGKIGSNWITAPLNAATPSTPATVDNTTVGCIGQIDSTNTQRIAQVSVSMGFTGYMMIVDRLVEGGGLNATLTSSQTVNTPALTRYTSAVGVLAAIELYVAIGATATIATIDYTNSGNASKSCEVAIGGTGLREVGRTIICPLAPGDVGVKSVQSVQLTATTATAGNFGVTLFKPLYYMPILSLGSQQMLFDSMLDCSGNCPIVENGACLSYLIVCGSTSSGITQSNIRFIET